MRGNAYINLPYPFILSNGVAGIEEVGPQGSTRATTSCLIHPLTSCGGKSIYEGWQKCVVGTEATTANIPASTTFGDTAAIPFALLTAVAALHLNLEVNKPGKKSWQPLSRANSNVYVA